LTWELLSRDLAPARKTNIFPSGVRLLLSDEEPVHDLGVVPQFGHDDLPVDRGRT